MNITMLRLRPIVRELQGIKIELQRMNDMKELELAHQGLYVKPPVADTSGEPPDAFYTDEEADAVRELEEELGKVGKKDV